MPKKKTSEVRTDYVFLDVVGFTANNRPIEAQTDIVFELNQIVRDTVESLGLKLPSDKVVFLPTGDGICIALLEGGPWSYDTPLVTALKIVREVSRYSASANDQYRRFQVRIGINSNRDNLITDINNQRNLAGAGINNASRIMGQADGNQILMGERVYETLIQHQKYRYSFSKPLKATVKHQHAITIRQFVANGYEGLNTDLPAAFQVLTPPLDDQTAYYFAYLIRHRHMLPSLLEDFHGDNHAAVILWWLLALKAARTARVKKPVEIELNQAILREKLKSYSSLEADLKHTLFSFISENQLAAYEASFEHDELPEYLFINRDGTRKLNEENRAIYDAFELERWRP